MTDPYRERDVVDRDTTVVSEDRGTGLGAILAILLVIALLIAVWYFTLGPGHVTVNVNNNGGTTQPVPSVQAPAGGGQASQAPASPAAS